MTLYALKQYLNKLDLDEDTTVMIATYDEYGQDFRCTLAGVFYDCAANVVVLREGV